MATLALYWPACHFDFVNYDDADYVTSNTHVLAGLNSRTLAWALSAGEASNWHPLTWLSHALDCQIFGPRPGPMHLVSVLFHCLNSVLAYLVLRRLTGAPGRSAVVAAIFAVHPLHVESVAWISERKDLLSGLFFWLTLEAYTSYARQGSRLAYVRSLAMFALGLASKPMLVTLPFVLLLLDWWPLGRARIPGLTSGAEQPDGNEPAGWVGARRLDRLVAAKLPFFALSAASCVVTFFVQRHGGAVSTVLPLGARLANACISYVRYIGKAFWPVNLSVLYPHPGHWPVWQALAAGGVLAGLSAAAALASRRRPYAAVGWLWFAGMLVPVIGLVQVGVQAMADRYMYLPLVGLTIVVVWEAHHWLGGAPAGRALLAATAGVAVAAFALVTRHQMLFWRDSEALFHRAVQVTDRNYLAYNNLGFYLSNHGRAAEGMTNYLQSLVINGSYMDALNNVGFALAGQRRFAEAIPYYEAALRASPRHPEVENNLGNALAELGRVDEAVRHYETALARNPDHADANNNLGIALAMRGRLDEAVVRFRRALRAKPDDAGSYSNLGNALAAQQKFDEAVESYRESLRLRPQDPQARNNLANVLVQLGQVDEAIPLYEEALRSTPDNPEAHTNLGRVLFVRERFEEAARHYQAALQAKPDYAPARCGLGDILMRLGRKDEAAAQFREALRIDPSLAGARRQLELLNGGR